uniref:Uncharacterized protein n=1 Tax=Ciona savignyi TaxID=51511 RepID=H2YGR7_CIOSA
MVQQIAALFDDFPTKKMLFLVFRQRFCELCFCEEIQDVSMVLKDIIEQLHTICSEQEYNGMIESVHEYYTEM